MKLAVHHFHLAFIKSILPCLDYGSGQTMPNLDPISLWRGDNNGTDGRGESWFYKNKNMCECRVADGQTDGLRISNPLSASLPTNSVCQNVVRNTHDYVNWRW